MSFSANSEGPNRIVPKTPTVKKPSKSVEQNHFLLEELLRECFSPPAAATADMTSFEGAASAGPEAEEERQRPRFSLDRLVPPQLITASDDDDAVPLSSQSASVSASFVLKRHPSVEIACHGIVQLVGDDTTTTTTKNAAAAEDEYMLSRSANAARFSGDGSDVSGGSTTPTTTASSLPPRLGCSSPAATDSPRQRHGISLLERLVKCHPIWFLSHLDRQAVAHLLTAQPPGVFIVRASSRGFRSSAVGGGSPASNGCSIRAPPPPPVPSTKRRVDVMALSVRLAPNSVERASTDAREPELDHFLVEAVGSGTAVRLEGSPYTFNSLPLLLEHYCLDGEGELKVRLNLPRTLARCESIQTLQGIALMGQDFWTSPLSASPPSSSSFYPNSSCPPPPFPPKPVPPAPMVLYNPMSTFGQQHQQQQQQRSRAVHSPSSVTSSASSPPQLFHPPHHHPPSSLQPPPSSPSPTASSSTFMYCSASSASMEHFPTSQHHCCCCCNPCPSSNHHNGHVPLRKSHSVHGRPLNAFPSRGMRCSWENDGPPSSPQSLREGRVGNGGFLRGLFSPSPQRRHPPPPPPPPPDAGKKTTTNRSRTMANRNDFYGTLWEEPELNGDWSYQQQQRRGGGDVVPVAEEQQKGAKSFFARLKGFKRTNSTSSAAVGRPKRENSGASFDDSSGTLSQMSPEVLRVRQLAFRRTNTDTGGGAIASALVRLKSLNEGGQQQHQQQQQPSTTTTTASSNREKPHNVNFPLARVLPQPRTTPNKSDGEAMRVGEDGRGGTLRGQQRPKFATPAIEGICLNSSLHHHHHQGNNLLMARNKSDISLCHHQSSNIPMPINRLLQQKGTTMDGHPMVTPAAHRHLPITSSKGQRQNNNNNNTNDVGRRHFVCDENLGDNVTLWRTSNGEHRNSSSSTTNSSNRTSKTAVAAVRPQLKQMQQPSGGTLVKQRKAPDVPVKSHSSEYSLLGELLTQRRSDQRNSAELAETVVDNTAATTAAGHLNVDETARHGLIIEDEEDDSHSVAGTDFNEPWDSNAWENLMDLARFGDGRMEESPRMSELVPESDSLEMMEKAARMANCSRSHFPHITAGAHRRSLMRAHGTSSLMDISGVGSGTTDHTKSRESGTSESISRTNGLNFGRSSSKQQQHHHRPIPACSSSVDELSTHPNKSTSICPSLVPVFSPSRLRNLANEHPGEEDPAKVIQRYVEALSKDDQTLFEAALHQFIECTLLSREKDPYVVIRRVRQFINGMKNYLMRIGEADLHPIIKRERSRLNIDEFLNIDAILEEVLVKILLAKLKAHLYRLMILESTSNGELRRLTENIAQVRSMSAAELGFPEGTELPDSARMEQISRQLRKMQNHYSPLKKVQLLLRVLSLAVPCASLSSVSGSDHSSRQHNHRPSNELSSPPQQLRTPKAYQHSSSYYALSPALSTLSPAFSMSRHRTTSGSSSCAAAAALKHPPADELIRWLVYLLARSSTINCEIEAWYMWELLPQQVLSTGDASYFLSVLFSAVHVLKHPESIRRLKNVELAQSGGGGGAHQLYSFADFMGSQSTLQDSDESDLLLRVAIPNEQEGTIEYHSFPVLPKMNVAKLCRMIAHQFSVTNPEDYRLYLIFDEYEAPMEPTQIPHLMRNQMNETARPHLFVYKRSETNISWSRQAVANFFGANNTTVLMNPPPLMVANGRERR